jgi:hypothetical protein
MPDSPAACIHFRFVRTRYHTAIMHFRRGARTFTRHALPFPLDSNDFRIGPTHSRRTRRHRNVQQIDSSGSCTHFPVTMKLSRIPCTHRPPLHDDFPFVGYCFPIA